MTNDVQVFSNGKIDLSVKEVDGQVYFEVKAVADQMDSKGSFEAV